MMKEILDQPGFIRTGSQNLRNMFRAQWENFDPNKLSLFALACLCGNYDIVKEAIESGAAPDLNATQTPFQYGFVTFTVMGAHRIRPGSPDTQPLRHVDGLNCLIASGAPLDIPDIFGYTALHHACVPPGGLPDVAKLLLEKGANVNAQNRYGEMPIFLPFQGGDVALVNILMEHGADLDIADGNGDSPRKLYTIFGPEVTAAVQRWERKRKGEVAPREEKWCENCKTRGSEMKQCARCHVTRYCSIECQRANWELHKLVCNPFSADTTVTLKPTYNGVMTSISRADFTRQVLGLADATSSPVRSGPTKNRAENKRMAIKVQVPTNKSIDSESSMFIYNKKRDFVCNVSRASDPGAFDAVVQIVRSQGVDGARAYFSAVLKNADELVVKISEVLAEQPF